MKVLMATDGSRHAEYAERLMLNLLGEKSESLDVIAITVCPSGDLHTMGGDFPSAVLEVVDQNRQRSADVLASLAGRLGPRVNSLGTVILDGHPAKEILHQIEDLEPDLCVLGSHGWTFSERFFLGSVSSQIAKHASCSVLIAKPKENSFDAAHCERILLADDVSSRAHDASALVDSLPFIHDRTTRLVSVVQDSFAFEALMPEQLAEIVDQKKQATKARIEKDLSLLKEQNQAIECEVRVGHSVPQELVNAANDFSADLIVLGGRRKSLLERALLGSVSLSVLHLAPCSVWIKR